VPAVDLSFWRSVTAMATLVPFLGSVPRGLWTRIGRNWLYVGICGLLGVSLFNTLIYLAGRSTTATNLALLAVVAPVFMLLFGRLSGGEPITSRRAVGSVIALVGVAALVSGGSPADLAEIRGHPGDLLMVLATAAFAAYSLLVRRRPAELDDRTFLFAIFTVGALSLLPCYAISLWTGGVTRISWVVVGSVLYVGVGSSVVAYAAWNRAIRLLGAEKTSFIYYLVPVLTALLSWLVLGEGIGLPDFVQMAVIILGVVIGSHR
jgi:drug/metabolite transporter (DMT)-like permease